MADEINNPLQSGAPVGDNAAPEFKRLYALMLLRDAGSNNVRPNNDIAAVPDAAQ